MIKSKKILAILTGLLIALVFSPASIADVSYRVKSSDNLNRIAEREYEGSGLTKSQILVGIYASNPKSFKNGNINKINRGQRLVLPDADKIGQLSHGEAELVLSARKKGKKKKRVKSTKSKRRTKKKKVIRKKTNTNSVEKKRNVQKIDKLEKESASLKNRLEQLLSEKTATDNKLKELEDSLQQALKNTALVATVKQAEKAAVKQENKEKTSSEVQRVAERSNEKLREKNELLEKQLLASKKEVVEKTRENITKERAIKDSATPVPLQQKNTAVAPTVKNKVPEKNELKTEASGGKSMFDISNRYLQWALLSLLLLPLVWFARRFISSKKVKEQPVWVTATEEQNSMLSPGNERIDTHYQEAPLESSIKLDVASAYLESGDTDEAIQILNEVVIDGNAEQQAQAKALLDSI